MFEAAILLIFFMMPFTYTPGPGNMVFAANGARSGLRSTVPANIGYHAANFLVALLVGFGFLQMLENYPQVFSGLKILGAGYILWIAWRLGKSDAQQAKSEARTITFTDGVFLFLLNPKAYVSMSLAFTLFMDSFGVGYGASVLLITVIYTGNNVVAFLLWALIGEQIAARFERPETAQKLNIIFAVTLVAVAIWILIS